MAWQIAHVCRIGWPHIGGMEAFVGGLAAAQAARGHDVRVITLDRAITDGSPLPPGQWRGVPYTRLPRVGPRRYPLARGLVAAVRGADLVHAHGLDGLCDLLVHSRSRHGARVGVSTHGGYFHTPRHRPLKAAWLRTVTRATLAGADAVWFTSEADRVTLAPAGAHGEVLPDGVDVERFGAVQRRPEPGLWVVPGRVDVHKGIDDLVDAVGHLARRSRRDIRVEVVGPERVPGLVERLKARARALDVGDRVRFLGAVSDEAYLDALARCELALFPSRYEGFGIAVVEAMAAGVAPVVAAIPAFDRLVRPGVDGFAVDFRDPAAAAVALEGLVRSLEVEDAARQSARRFAWDQVVEHWDRAYARVIGRAP